MKLTPQTLESLLAIPSRSGLARAIQEKELDIPLPQVRRLRARLDELAAPAHPLRLGIVHTYTTDLLDPWIAFEASLQDLAVDVYHAPYGMVLQEARPDSGLVRHRPDVTVLMLQREDLHPDLAQPLGAFPSSKQEEMRGAALAHLRSIVGQFRAHVDGLLLLTLLPAPAGPGLGLYDAQSERSEAAWWATLKASIAQFLRDEVRASMLLDLDEPVALIGRSVFFDLRFWYSSRFPFSAAGAREVARRLAAVGAVVKHPKAKVIVVDADNTLWGGIIGEDGMHGIALGPDYPGNAFVAFQRRLLDLQQRGFVLAMCSKNNPADVDEVLRNHSHQLLKDHHFVARRVNWEPKPNNLRSLAEELNLGLDSFIFIDDSEHECAAVRYELPQVEVVQAPKNPIDLASCLDRVARLEVLALTAEDQAKTAMYVMERRRRELEQDITQRGGNIDEYLRSLGMKMQIFIDDAAQVARLAQLTQKTNQFNLTTRRYTEQQVQDFIDSPDWTVAHFSLADTFGNSGVVGLAMFRRTAPHAAMLDTFLMSCRVIGRHAESAFLESLLALLAKQGITQVDAQFLPTRKNVLAKDFLPLHGFTAGVENSHRRNLAAMAPRSAAEFPIEVSVFGTDKSAAATTAGAA